MLKKGYVLIGHNMVQRFSYFSEVGARGLLNLGKTQLSHQNWENWIWFKRTKSPFKLSDLKL